MVLDDAANPGPSDLLVRINGDNPTFRLKAASTPRYFLELTEPRIIDFLWIACAVFQADARITRGSTKRTGFGAAWYRNFQFRVAVRDRAFWSRTDVTAALVETITFLTGDAVAFEFTDFLGPPPDQSSLRFDSNAPHFQADEVILFSGGLDSLAGTVQTLATGTGKIALVTHRSAPKVMGAQTRLVEELRRGFADRIFWIPVHATLVGHRAGETTQRSRTLLFSALGLLAARMVGSRRVHFYENGIVSLNLPIAQQVVSTMATRTTHPLALHKLSALLSLITANQFIVDNPYVWQTKAEVVQRLAACGGTDLIRKARSCSSVMTRSILHTHCGACSQCLDRRFAMLASGLQDADPDEMYETQLFEGERENERDRTMALEWTRHADSLADIDDKAFLRRFAAEISLVSDGFPTGTAPDVLAQALAMHRRHGGGVRRTLEAAATRYAPDIIRNTLPDTALIRMLIAERAGHIDLAGLRRVAHVPSPDQDDDPDIVHSIFPLSVVLEKGSKDWTVKVAGLGDIIGAPANLVADLEPYHRNDVEQGVRRDEHRYLMPYDLHASKASVRQNVKRCRDQLAELYELVEGEPPPRELLIEGKAPKGYRLDPEGRFSRQGE